MVSGRRQDVKAVFADLMIGILLLILDLSDITIQERFDKHSVEDWVRLEQYIDTWGDRLMESAAVL